ncbi:MAG: HxsD-like protein [Candidatus Woesearchaeota archaeon]
MKTKITIEGDTARITLNQQFYPKEAIEKAIAAFADIVTISHEEDTITMSGKDIQKVADEFCNYILGITI